MNDTSLISGCRCPFSELTSRSTFAIDSVVSFRRTGEGLCHTHACIRSPSKPLPLFRFTKRGLGCFAKHLIQLPFFPCGSNGKEFACNVGDLGSIPGLGRCPGEGKGNPLQYSCWKSLHGQRSLAGCSPWDCRVEHD